MASEQFGLEERELPDLDLGFEKRVPGRTTRFEVTIVHAALR
jgi:hypothetical protein